MVNYHETYMYFNNSYQSCTAVHSTARYLHVTARYLHANARHSTLMHATARYGCCRSCHSGCDISGYFVSNFRNTVLTEKKNGSG